MARDDMRERPLPFLTADIGGTGGVIKRFDDDFQVEEMPAYEASGTGTHTYFTIEKRGLTTLAAIRLIARALHRKPPEIGYAGMKDAHGVTRQRLSIEHVDPAAIAALDIGRIRVLQIERHTNKIKLGHLAGNRFRVRIRDIHPGAAVVAKTVFERLTARGIPNYFGPQRFGARGDNAHVGRAVLEGDYEEALARVLGMPNEFDRADVRRARELYDAGDLEAAVNAWPQGFGDSARLCRAVIQAGGDARKAWRAVHHSLRRLYVSAVQSELFNQVLAKRIDTVDEVQAGDLAWKHTNGATFLVEDAAVEQPRARAFEISPSGPLFGRKMRFPEGDPERIERSTLAASGLSEAQMYGRDGVKLEGARRPLRVPPGDAVIEDGHDQNGYFVELHFHLPPGAYATCVVREVCKNEPAARLPDEE